MLNSLQRLLSIRFFCITATIALIFITSLFFLANLSWLLLAILGAILFILIGLGSLIFYQLTAKLISPIKRLTEQTKRLDKGMPAQKERILANNEIGELAQTIYEMAADLELQNRSVKYLAFHDSLTGLSNRVNFQMQLEDRIVDAANRRHQCAMIYLDLDDFKEINDTRGHEYGDRALRTIANRISAVLEECGKNKNLHAPLLARIGGDEFTILVSGKLQNDDISEVSEALLQRVSRPLEIDGDIFQLSGSIGIAFYPTDALSASALFNSADMAMYASKTAGKGTYRFFTESMNDNREQLGRMKTEFKAALENPGELVLVYQPVVDLNSGRVIGAEALIRWNHPQRGQLDPDQFMPMVEQNEIALATDLWAIEQVTSFLTKADLSTRPEFRISANISASNLGREQFPAAVSKLIQKTPEISRYLQLEVTETYLHRDEDCAQRSLKQLKEIGLSIWLDDFCTGYSSLHHISIFPVDGVKIDQRFVQKIDRNENNQLLVAALVSMAESFDIELIAEGLERTDDLYQLQKLGCLYAQGFLFSRPVTEHELLEIVRDDRLLM